MGLEPTPGPWQGPVLPLYYGRPNHRNSNTPAIRRQDLRGIQIAKRLANTPEERRGSGQASRQDPKTMGSPDLQYSSGFYDGRFTLPLGKFGGLFPVCIHAGKPFSVLVKHSHLPMLVFAPSIFSELGTFSCGFGFGHGLNISMKIREHKYQFGQYFARKQIILQYRVGCIDEC
jgi:hypothetical protein